jgi:hypothetical protein
MGGRASFMLDARDAEAPSGTGGAAEGAAGPSVSANLGTPLRK